MAEVDSRAGGIPSLEDCSQSRDGAYSCPIGPVTRTYTSSPGIPFCGLSRFAGTNITRNAEVISVGLYPRTSILVIPPRVEWIGTRTQLSLTSVARGS